MSAAIKPEIYISWIPTGQIGLKPQIYATIIPTPVIEKASADTNRKISNPESTSGDLLLQIGNGEKVSADVARHVISTDTVTADTLRKLFVEENISGDTLIKIVQSAEIHADTYREVQSTEKIIGDTSRKIGVTTVNADLHRKIIASTKSNSDTCRQVANGETISGDTSLQVTCAEAAHADTFRKVEDSTPTVTKADTNRVVGIREKVIADTSRKFAQREKASADTLLQTTIAEKIIADTMRGLRDVARADTCRKVTRAEKAVAKTVIRIPHVLNYILQEKPVTFTASKKNLLAANNPLSLINTFKDYGVTAINITLSEKTLSDTFSFDIASRSMDINEAVQGWLLDYPFSFLVEETTQTELIQSVKGMYSLDMLLYTQFFLPSTKIESNNGQIVESTVKTVSSNGTVESLSGSDVNKHTTTRIVKKTTTSTSKSFTYFYPTATEYAYRVAYHLGLNLIVLLDGFTPYGLSGDQRITYFDLLNSVFGWTSRLPQRQINVFIRGGILYCIQRGKELSVFDITNLQHSRPTIKKRLIRSLWSNPKNESDNETSTDDTGDTEVISDDTGDDGGIFDDDDDDDDGTDNGDDWTDDYDYETVPIPYSGTIDFEGDDYQTTLQYKIGLLQKEYHLTKNGKATVTSNTTFDYIEAGTVDEKTGYAGFYLVKKKTETTSHVNNDYVAPTSDDAEFATSAVDADYTDIKQTNTVTYQYRRTGGDNIYLLRERDETTTETYEENPKTGKMEVADTTTDLRETLHMPLGNGWYGQVVYVNGECQGSNISHGKPGNKVSQFSIDEFQRTFTKEKPLPDTGEDGDDTGGDTGGGTGDDTGGDTGGDDTGVDTGSDTGSGDDYDDWRRKLAPFADTSFPVREFDLLKKLTNDLLWLNRKTEETVTVDLISKIENGVPEINHIVDFTERILFNGAEYYLVSNNISFTPRKLIQKLTLIRWY